MHHVSNMEADELQQQTTTPATLLSAQSRKLRLQLIQTQQNWTQTTRKHCPAASKRPTHHVIKLQSSPSGNTGNHQKPTGGHQHTSACVSLICPNLMNIKKAQFGGASVTLERTASRISFRPQQLQGPGKLLHHVTPQ